MESKETTITTPKILRRIQFALILVIGFLLGAHITKWEAVRVDSITLWLLGLLSIIPFVELIRKIKIGEFEAEIGRDEIAKVQAKASVELTAAPDDEDEEPEERIRELLREDPRLALAKVRIELEEALKRLYATTAEAEPDWRRLSLSRLVDGLVRKEILNSSIAATLRDVITLANRAVHGERVEAAAAEELALLGVRLVYELQQLHEERILKPVEKTVINSQDVEQYRSAKYKVMTIVPLVEKPTKNTYLLAQDDLDFFLDHYTEYAEFIINIERVQ